MTRPPHILQELSKKTAAPKVDAGPKVVDRISTHATQDALLLAVLAPHLRSATLPWQAQFPFCSWGFVGRGDSECGGAASYGRKQEVRPTTRVGRPTTAALMCRPASCTWQTWKCTCLPCRTLLRHLDSPWRLQQEITTLESASSVKQLQEAGSIR